MLAALTSASVFLVHGIIQPVLQHIFLQMKFMDKIVWHVHDSLLQELKNVLKDVPEIALAVGSEPIADVLGIEENDDESVRSALQSVFTKLMSASKELVSDLVVKLRARLDAEKQVIFLVDIELLFSFLQFFSFL